MRLGRWVECGLNSLNTHGQESGLVRNICKSHVVGISRCLVVSVSLSPSFLPFYLAGYGCGGGGFGRGGDRPECLASSFHGTIAQVFF